MEDGQRAPVAEVAGEGWGQVRFGGLDAAAGPNPHARFRLGMGRSIQMGAVQRRELAHLRWRRARAATCVARLAHGPPRTDWLSGGSSTTDSDRRTCRRRICRLAAVRRNRGGGRVERRVQKVHGIVRGGQLFGEPISEGLVAERQSCIR